MKLAEKIFLSIPLPFSKWVFDISRSFLFNDKRNAGFRKAVSLVKENNIKGDYLEFGVYKGSSLIQFNNLFKEFSLNDVRMFAFDAFKGLPSSEGSAFKKGEFHFPKEFFLKRIKKAGVDPGSLIVVEGFFNESLTPRVKKDCKLDKACIIHIDCDLYESTVDVLNFVKELVQDGTVLIPDDYLSFQNEPDPLQHGEEKAFKEWELFPLFEEIYTIGVSKAFLCRKKKINS